MNLRGLYSREPNFQKLCVFLWRCFDHHNISRMNYSSYRSLALKRYLCLKFIREYCTFPHDIMIISYTVLKTFYHFLRGILLTIQRDGMRGKTMLFWKPPGIWHFSIDLLPHWFNMLSFAILMSQIFLSKNWKSSAISK